MLLNSCAKWKKRGSFQKNNNLLLYAIQLVCVLKWNKMDSFQKKQKTPIYYCMLFNLCAYWNETRWTVFKKTKNQFITVCYSTCVQIEMKQGDSFQKTTIYYCMLFNLCAYWNETRGTVFKKINNLLQYAIQLVCILKWNKRDSFQKNINLLSNLLLYAIQQEGQFSKKWTKQPNLLQYAIQQEGQFSKKTIYYCMLFNLCVYWNETREAVFKKTQLMTICYRLMCEMKKEGQFSKNNNLLLYAIQLVCILKWNKRDSFQKNNKIPNLLQYAIQQEGQFSKKQQKHQFITVCYSTTETRVSFQKTTIYYNMLFNLCAVLKWNKSGQFSKKTIYYCMLFNLCAYWNETRGTVFKKITKTPIYYSMLFNKRGSFQKKTIYYCMIFNLCVYWNETREAVFKKITNWWQYATDSCANEKRGAVFKKTTIYYCMLFNLCVYWNETRGTVFKKNKKHQFITVCYWTCVQLKWNKMDSFQKNCMLFNLCAYWNETRWTVFKKITKTPIYYIMLFKKRGSFQKTTIYYCMLFNLCVYWNWNETRLKKEGQFSKKNNLLLYAIQLVCVLKWN